MNPLKYIETIVLEILDRSRFWNDRRKKKFSIVKFNAKELAYAFLRQHDGESLIKAQKIKVWYNSQELHLCVRDLIYGTNNRIANTSVEFIYRKMMFSEIKWPAVTINRISRVRWANDHEKLVNEIPKIDINGDYSLNNVDELRMVPCMSCRDIDNDQSLVMDSTQENTKTSFCRNCRLRRSVNDLEKLINGVDGTNENHFRSSIHIDVNQVEIPELH